LSDISGGRNIYQFNSRFTSNIFYDPEPNECGFCFEKGYLVDDCCYYKDWNYEYFEEACTEYYSFIKPLSLSKGRSYLAS
jgi:hypothetical protein